ncbi:hypothetical protein GGQ97_001536 [Sphingomonas kaistensis]|uniref:Helix-turn-helix domain-containing protein n=1 Tax=Sphingomonas kaistensis TaxID=298708 RepID=A0A7X5Y5U0_9SPHN|nr:DNA-binding protein [Sphingomonas kaistensis]NJC05743.1 hypothetical protein [Sphingomonas kaistensis]
MKKKFENPVVEDRLDPLAMTVEQAARAANTSRSELYNVLGRGLEGGLEGKKLGRRTLILTEDLRRYLRSLPSYRSSKAQMD